MKYKQSALLLAAVGLLAGNTVAQATDVQKGFPALIQVAAGNTVALETQATGTLTYECKREKEPLTTYKWTIAGPKAALKDRDGNDVGSYDGPPAKWSHNDGSFVTGSQVAVSPNGEKNIPFQLVKADVTGGQGVLTTVSYIQRVATKGGAAPTSKCSADNAGAKEVVDYQADYIFWKAN